MKFSHLDALNLNLSNERMRLAGAKNAKEIELRKVYVAQLEKEVAGERAFLGLAAEIEVSDADLDSLFD